MSKMNTRTIGLVGAAAAGVLFMSGFPSQIAGNGIETPGVKAIGDRWSSGGGTNVHTPGVATGRGNAEDTLERQTNPKGQRTQHFKDNHDAQRVETVQEKPWNKA